MSHNWKEERTREGENSQLWRVWIQSISKVYFTQIEGEKRMLCAPKHWRKLLYWKEHLNFYGSNIRSMMKFLERVHFKSGKTKLLLITGIGKGKWKKAGRAELKRTTNTSYSHGAGFGQCPSFEGSTHMPNFRAPESNNGCLQSGSTAPQVWGRSCLWGVDKVVLKGLPLPAWKKARPHTPSHKGLLKWIMPKCGDQQGWRMCTFSAHAFICHSFLFTCSETACVGGDQVSPSYSPPCLIPTTAHVLKWFNIQDGDLTSDSTLFLDLLPPTTDPYNRDSCGLPHLTYAHLCGESIELKRMGCSHINSTLSYWDIYVLNIL